MSRVQVVKDSIMFTIKQAEAQSARKVTLKANLVKMA